MDENYEWWRRNQEDYINSLRGKYVLIANKGVIASDKDLNNLEIMAKDYEHHIIIRVDTLEISKKLKIRVPFKVK